MHKTKSMRAKIRCSRAGSTQQPTPKEGRTKVQVETSLTAVEVVRPYEDPKVLRRSYACTYA